MDYNVIGNGIIKNLELYSIYYTGCFKNKLDDELANGTADVSDVLSGTLTAGIVALYEAKKITSKEVLRLMDYVQSRFSSQMTPDKLHELMTMANDVLSVVSMPSSLQFYQMQCMHVDEAMHSKEFKKALKQYKHDKEVMTRIKFVKRVFKALKHISRSEAMSADLDRTIRKTTSDAVKDVVKRYSSDNDVRISTSAYRPVLQSMFEKDSDVLYLEAILENPDFAKCAYAEIVQKLSEKLSNPDPDWNADLIKIFTNYLNRYKVLLKVAENANSDESVLRDCLTAFKTS